MNVYDFDGTIYEGDSSIDFYMYCLKKHPKILKALPTQMKGFLLYRFHKINKTRLKEYYFSFLRALEKPELDVEKFWDENRNKIKSWYLKQKNPLDVIISASPEFLLRPILNIIGIYHLIASDVDIHTGKFRSDNCHDEINPVYFNQRYPDEHIDNFYSDSLSDEPMARLADAAWLIRHDQIKKWSIT